MIKVLFFIHDLMHGGAEKVLVNLVNNMDKKKFDITVLCLFDEGVNKKYLNSDIHYKYVFKNTFRGNTIFLKLFSPKTLYKKMIKDEYDIVISYLEGSCTRIIAGANNDLKKIAWVHATESVEEFKYSYRSLKEAKETYSKYDKVICVSEEVSKNLSKLTGVKNRIEVKYNVNETDKIINLSNIHAEEIKQEENILNICAVGKVVHNKGFMRLAHTCKRLWDKGYRMKVYILGIGDEQDKIITYLKENGIEDAFCFLGYQENPYKYIAACDLFVCSSYKEGFSTATTEALIVGTPVVVTKCSGMREMLGDNEYGLIVDNSEDGIYKGIKKFMDDKELLIHYTNQAKIRGKFFEKQRIVDDIQNMMIDLIQE